MFEAIIGGVVVLGGYVLKDWLTRRKTKAQRAEEHRGHEIEAEEARRLLMADVRKEIELIVSQRDEARAERDTADLRARNAEARALQSRDEHRQCMEVVSELRARVERLEKVIQEAGLDVPNGH